MIGVQRLSKIVHQHVKRCTILQHICETHHLTSAESTADFQLMSRSLKFYPTRIQQFCQTHHLYSTEINSDAKHLVSNTRLKSRPVGAHDRIVEKVSELGIKDSVICQALIDHPELASFPYLVWKKCVKDLLELGVSASKVVAMIVKCPELLRQRSEDLMLSWTCWKKELKTNDEVVNLVQTHPHYLLYSKKVILSRLGFLKNHFVNKGVNVLLNCPDMLDLDLEEVQHVLLYVTNTMNIKKESEIYKSSVLNHPLIEVKTRHIFLERCGKFNPPNPKHDVNVPTGNPTLSMIYDVPIKEFATLVAGLTVEEYIVFQELYEMELADDSDFDSDDELD